MFCCDAIHSLMRGGCFSGHALAHPRLLTKLMRDGFKKGLHARVLRNGETRFDAESRGDTAGQGGASCEVHVEAAPKEAFKHFEVGAGKFGQRRRWQHHAQMRRAIPDGPMNRPADHCANRGLSMKTLRE